MTPYYFMLGLPLIISVLYGGNSNRIENKKKQRFILIVFFTILLLILSLRHRTVGADTVNYINMFFRNAKMSFSRIL